MSPIVLPLFFTIFLRPFGTDNATIEPAAATVKGTVRIQTALTSVSRARGSRYRTRGQADAAAAAPTTRTPEVTNVVVYLEETGRKRSYPPPTQLARLIQQNTTFVPHVLPVLRGTKVEIINKDDYYHNVFSNSEGKRFNIGRQVTNAVVTEVFETSAFIPVFCDVHLDMSAYVVVLDNPFFAQPVSDGSFSISGIPTGTYRLNVWHERLSGTPQEIVIEEGAVLSFVLDL